MTDVVYRLQESNPQSTIVINFNGYIPFKDVQIGVNNVNQIKAKYTDGLKLYIMHNDSIIVIFAYRVDINSIHVQIDMSTIPNDQQFLAEDKVFTMAFSVLCYMIKNDVTEIDLTKFKCSDKITVSFPDFEEEFNSWIERNFDYENNS